LFAEVSGAQTDAPRYSARQTRDSAGLEGRKVKTNGVENDGY
jgi:hypothetical protein